MNQLSLFRLEQAYLRELREDPDERRLVWTLLDITQTEIDGSSGGLTREEYADRFSDLLLQAHYNA